MTTARTGGEPVGERDALEAPGRDERFEIARETSTMALYLAIVLLAELSAWPVDVGDATIIVSAVWGTALGLAIAHWFAFSISTRLLWGGRETRTDRLASVGQLAAAVAVATVASIPFAFGAGEGAFTAAGVALTLLIALAGVRVARVGGASWRATVLFAALILLVAGVVVGVKAGLTH